MIEEIDESNQDVKKLKLVIPRSQIFIGEIINAAKACFMFEDRHTNDDA